MAVADYPAPRTDRQVSGGGGGGALAAVNPPRIRLWPFHIRETGLRGTVVSPRLQGPAVIEVLSMAHTTQGNTPIPGVQLFVSQDNGGAGSNLALEPGPTGDRIFDTLSQADDTSQSNTSTTGLVLPNLTVVPSHEVQRRIAYPVYLGEFFLKLSASANTAPSLIVVHGYVRIIEGLSAEDLPNFL